MKRVKTLLSGILAVTLCAGSALAVGEVVEKKASLDDALAIISVTDLHGFIDGAGSVAAQVAPMINGMMLKQMIGGKVGDPMLEGIPQGKGLSVVIMNPTNIFSVMEVAAPQITTYSNALSTMGLQSKIVDGLLVNAKDAASMELGIALAEDVQDKVLDERSPSLLATAKPAVLIEANSQKIDSMLQMMVMMASMQQQQPGQTTTPEQAQITAKILEGEVRVLLSIAKQLESYGLEVLPKDGSVKLIETFDAAPNTRLEALLTSPIENKLNPKITAGMLDSSAIMIDYCMANPKALATFIEGEANQLIADMKIEGTFIKGYVDMMNKWIGLFGGTMAETALSGSSNKLDCVYLLETTDDAAMLELYKTMQADMETFGFFKMYESMGMPISVEFKEAVREYKGAPIHQFDMKMSFEGMPADQRAEMEKLLGDMTMDIAFKDNVAIIAMNAGIESIIDKLGAEDIAVTPLTAQKLFDDGGFCYVDINLDKYLAFVAAFIPPSQQTAAQIKQMATLLKGADPISCAASRDDGVAKVELNLSGELIARVGQMVMMMQMQQMQQQPGQSSPATGPAQ